MNPVQRYYKIHQLLVTRQLIKPTHFQLPGLQKLVEAIPGWIKEGAHPFANPAFTLSAGTHTKGGIPTGE